jgi:hypothetical protein
VSAPDFYRRLLDALEQGPVVVEEARELADQGLWDAAAANLTAWRLETAGVIDSLSGASFDTVAELERAAHAVRTGARLCALVGDAAAHARRQSAGAGEWLQ